MLKLVVQAMFLLLLAGILFWCLAYRHFHRQHRKYRDAASSWRRWHQWLVGLIALLAIVLPVVIVLSSDPGAPDLFLMGY